MNPERKPLAGRRAALYARVSTDKQSQEGTIESQLALLRERIVADGGTAEAELCFIEDGVSGTTLTRPALERLRDQAAAGTIDRLYVLAPHRLARDLADQLVLMKEFQKGGVEVVFLNRAVGETPEDCLLLQIQGVVAEYERKQILDRTRRGKLHAARCGRVSVLTRAPFGYRYIDKHQGGGEASYEIVPEEAELVRQIFAWVGREGCSLREAARRLDRLGVRPRKGKEHWQGTTVSAMLRNPTYQGQAVFGRKRCGERRPQLRPRRGQPEVPRYAYSCYRTEPDEQIRIAVPAVVEAELFAAVQERLQHNARRLRQRQTGPRFLLQGLAVCAECGYAVYGSSRSSRGKPYSYYRCIGSIPGRSEGCPLCSNPSMRTADLDAAVWQDVCALLSEPERLRQELERRQQRPASSESVSEVSRLRAAMAKLRQGMSRLLDAYTDGLVEPADFQFRLRRLKDRLRQQEDQLQALNTELQQDQELHQVFSRLQDFADQIKAGLSQADWENRREIIKALVKQVEMGKDHLRVVYKVPPRPFAKAPNGGMSQHCASRQEDFRENRGKTERENKRGQKRSPVTLASGHANGSVI